ncbi:hypothetical protein BKA61DRAFT_517961 [Leptodontidium sp. MPI-SDFR-AT-0119]|nr:hypothetical protein BKA61DRAFT_517961 [Leptodontidium sp. MPI-SDFR-AT-0119]
MNLTMRGLHIFIFLATLLGLTRAQVDLSHVLIKIPKCTQLCSLKVLGPARCPLTDLPNCLCTNTTLQEELATCVLGSCNFTDQVVSTTIAQNEICEGVSQPSRSTEIIRDVIIIASVTFLVVLLRFLSRSIVTHRIWWDDWMIGIAAVLMVPMVVIPILNAQRGFGKHFWDVPPQNVTLLRKLYYVSQLLYVVVQNLAKISILFLYLRIFVNPRFRLYTKIVMGWAFCHTFAFLVADAFQCVPVKAVWDTTIDAKCINLQTLIYAGAGFSIVEDFIIMLLPISELRSLKLDLRKRIVLFFMFALGSFACITSMVRLKYIISYSNSIDLTWANVDIVIWSILETFMAVICASLVCIRPLLVKYLPVIFPVTEVSESRGSDMKSPSWSRRLSLKASSKLRNENGIELLSDDDEARAGLRDNKSNMTPLRVAQV